MEEVRHIALSVAQEDAVILSRLHILLDGNGRRSPEGEIDLQRVKQQQHIPGQHQHPLPEPGRHPCHSNHKFIEQRGAPPVRQLSWHRGEQLAAGRILGHPLGVSARMDHQDPFPPEAMLSPSLFA